MPRVRKSENEQANTYFLALIDFGKRMNGYSNDSLALSTRVSVGTIYNRMNDPDKLLLQEFRRIAKVLHFTDRDICAIVGVPYKGTTPLHAFGEEGTAI